MCWSLSSTFIWGTDSPVNMASSTMQEPLSNTISHGISTSEFLGLPAKSLKLEWSTLWLYDCSKVSWHFSAIGHKKIMSLLLYDLPNIYLCVEWVLVRGWGGMDSVREGERKGGRIRRSGGQKKTCDGLESHSNGVEKPNIIIAWTMVQKLLGQAGVTHFYFHLMQQQQQNKITTKLTNRTNISWKKFRAQYRSPFSMPVDLLFGNIKKVIKNHMLRVCTVLLKSKLTFLTLSSKLYPCISNFEWPETSSRKVWVSSLEDRKTRQSWICRLKKAFIRGNNSFLKDRIIE